MTLSDIIHNSDFHLLCALKEKLREAVLILYVLCMDEPICQLVEAEKRKDGSAERNLVMLIPRTLQYFNLATF